MNKTILVVVIVLIVIVGGYFLLKGGYRAPVPTTPAPTTPGEVSVPAPSAKEITVSGSEFNFNPSSIKVSVGERVKVTFRNRGRTPHNLTIEGLGISTKTIGGGKTDTIEFTAPASGTYTFFCSVSGHRASGMEGSLIIE